MADPSPKPDRFKPAMPAIPGVPAPAPEKQPEAESPAKPGPAPPWADRRMQVGAGIAVVFVIFLAVMLPQFLRKAPPPAPIVLDNSATTNTASSNPAASAAGDLPIAPGPIASPQDLDKPWTVVKFMMQLPTGERAPAQVVRLPGRDAAYWGFLSVAPYGQCELELEQDVEKIARDYGYHARHPMVVDSCTHTLYDPLSYGSTHGALARGQVVSGPGMRPPLMVEIVTQKGNVVATRSE